MRISFKKKCILCLIPSVVGTLVFYVIPYIRTVYYSLIDNQFKKNFVGLSNYIKVAENPYFRLALKNSLLLVVIGVPLLVGISVLLSLGFYLGGTKLGKGRIAFILPTVLPTAGLIIVWRTLFQGLDNNLPIYILFIWKNLGLCIIFQTAAFSLIRKEIYEAAKIDGANDFALHTKITIPMISPTILFCVLLAMVNSFSIFRESYLYYGGQYPPEHSYTLQYYMNNHFMKLNYQNLACSAVMTSLLVLGIVWCGFCWQRRHEM